MMKTSIEIDMKRQRAWELADGRLSAVDNEYVETVAQVLDWVLGDGDDPLEDYQED